ncbi:MAG: hypothetical protein WBM90_01730, partial [Acidimicrobiia bacterium]
MIRIAIAGLIAVGLAIGIWLLWPTEEPTVGSATTVAAASSTSSSQTASTPGTTASATTTSTVVASHVVETVEEAEEILRALWFGWFEGIYNQDVDRIREVVVLEEQIASARAAFGASFTGPPSPEGVTLLDFEILRSDEECLATWARLDITSFRG